MKNKIKVDDSGMIIYKDIKLDVTCENLLNIVSDDTNPKVEVYLDDEVKQIIRDEKINKLLSDR